VFSAQNAKWMTPPKLLEHLLFAGGTETIYDRLFDCCEVPFKIERIGLSFLGEIIGSGKLSRQTHRD
jgi:hypothetical protein